MKFSLAVVTVILCLPAFAQRDQSAMEQQLVALVNQERAKAGLPQLRVDAKLAEAARAHSQQMAQHGSLSHQLAGEPELSQRISATGLRFNAVAENVSSVSPANPDAAPPAATAHQGLMNSPPHRANILSPDYNAVGIGVVRQGRTFYTTEDFANAFQPASLSDAEKAVANAVNAQRRRHSLAPLRDVHLDRLAAMACDSKTDVNTLVHAFASARSAAVFTTWTPENLPKTMTQLSQEDGITAMSLQACPMPAERGGSGGFKIAAVFF